jgi:Holliday junction DNA helicase RuvA
MISHLTGTVFEKEPGAVILDVAGVGYRVHVSSATFASLPVESGASVSLYTHMAVREDSMDLYGFTDRDELSLFEMLLSVSGIGPKSALAVLSLAGAVTLRTAIAKNDVSYLTKVSGIGKKTAEKIIVELKDKMGSYASAGPELREDADVVEVLVSLGYSRDEAREVVKRLPEDAAGTSSRVKEALKLLAEHKK